MSKDYEDDFEDYSEDDFEDYSEDDFEDYSEDDFEDYSEDDFEDDGNFEFQENEEEIGEYYATPFFSVYATEIPDKFNPKKILERKKILLYDPLDKIQPYRKINPEAIKLETLQNNFIINGKSLKDNNSLPSLNKISVVMSKNKELMKQFDTSNEEEFQNNSQKPKFSNKK